MVNLVRPTDGVEITAPTVALPQGAKLWRCHPTRYAGDEMNPGPTPARPTGRFSFFGSPTVPALYAADTMQNALCETVLHDVPVQGGEVPTSALRGRSLTPIINDEPLQLLDLTGTAFRKIAVPPEQITRLPVRDYSSSVAWGEAAHAAGLDGIIWVSRHVDTDRSLVIYRDACSIDPTRTPRDYSRPADLNELTHHLAELNVTVLD